MINEQALKASEFGLPNEFDKLLRSIGSTRINAFTTHDGTIYFNLFPSHEIEKWLDIYATRFQNPVFRSFQSELEVVYEEKNRALDDLMGKIMEKMNSLLFPNLPYGQWSVLGKIEHLKKPSLSKMYDFYHKNYVAGNMALILTGNFKSEEVLPLIKAKFSALKPGKAPELNLPDLTPLEGNVVEKVRMTPWKAGLIGWQTIPKNHSDRITLDVCEYLLFNRSETGFINQLQHNYKIQLAMAFSKVYNDAGGFLIGFVPKIPIQYFSQCEKKDRRCFG